MSSYMQSNLGPLLSLHRVYGQVQRVESALTLGVLYTEKLSSLSLIRLVMSLYWLWCNLTYFGHLMVKANSWENT